MIAPSGRVEVRDRPRTRRGTLIQKERLMATTTAGAEPGAPQFRDSRAKWSEPDAEPAPNGRVRAFRCREGSAPASGSADKRIADFTHEELELVLVWRHGHRPA
jgi:hypothetical protein